MVTDPLGVNSTILQLVGTGGVGSGSGMFFFEQSTDIKVSPNATTNNFATLIFLFINFVLSKIMSGRGACQSTIRFILTRAKVQLSGFSVEFIHRFGFVLHLQFFVDVIQMALDGT